MDRKLIILAILASKLASGQVSQVVVSGLKSGAAAPVAPALVTGQVCNGFAASSPASCSLPSPVTAGNYIIASCYLSGQAPPTFGGSDNQGNSYTSSTPVLGADTGLYQWIAAGKVVTSSGTTTVSCTSDQFVASEMAIAAAEFSGIVASSPSDAGAGTGSNTSGTHSSGSTATTAQANELLIGGIYMACGGCTLTAGSGWTLATTATHSSPSLRLGLEYRVVSATGAYAATFTDSQGFGNWGAIIQTYKGN